MLGRRRQQQGQAFAIEQHGGAQVDVQLHVEALGLNLAHGRADAHAGVVHEHVQAAIALAVGLGHLLDLRLVGHVGRDRLHVEALIGQHRRGALQLLRPARRHRDGVALLAQNPGDGQPDTARSPRDDRCALCHLLSLRCGGETNAVQPESSGRRRAGAFHKSPVGSGRTATVVLGRGAPR